MPIAVSENASLRRLNSFGVEQRAARLVRIDEAADLAEAACALRGTAPRLVIGGGSNLLLTRDFEGTVLLLRTRGLRVLASEDDATIVEAEAGESWDGFVRWCLSLGLGGLENLSLIPGTVGASPIQNIGAYGTEMREHFDGLDAIDLDCGEVRSFGPDDCGFGYRDSVFKRPGAARWLVVRVRFRLPRTWTPRLDYGEIRAELARLGRQPSPSMIAQAVCAIRRRKLPDPAVLGNAGSFFKNPTVTPEQCQDIIGRDPHLVHYPMPDGSVKLAAGWLIDACGWKGKRVGNAAVYDRQALVLVNRGGKKHPATGGEVMTLARAIQTSVYERFGIRLEPEPVVV